MAILFASIAEKNRKTTLQPWVSLFFLLVLFISLPARAQVPRSEDPVEVIHTLASLEDRSTGTSGCEAAAAYIKQQFLRLEINPVESHRFSLPILRNSGSILLLPERGLKIALNPMRVNAVSPGTIGAEGVEGPLVYVGSGELNQFDGKEVENAVILMDLDSGKNWQNAAMLGAKALIYVDRGPTPKTFFEDKMELSPIRFPRFWLPFSKARELFGDFESAPDGRVGTRIRLTSDMTWQPIIGENIYGLIPGTDPVLRDQLVMVEAFYDSTAIVPGRSPGADEACGIAALLHLANHFRKNPPGRSVLLVATSGHAQELAGMRELIWSLDIRPRDLRKMRNELENAATRSRGNLEILKRMDPSASIGEEPSGRLKDALEDRVKTEVDKISRRLMMLRLQEMEEADPDRIRELTHRRLLLRRLGWKTDYAGLTMEEKKLLDELVPAAVKDHEAVLRDAEQQLQLLASATRFRSLVKDMDLSAAVSLHLSSHGDGIGAFNQGWLYPLKPEISRIEAYSALDQVLRDAASQTEPAQDSFPFLDTLRPSRLRSWQDYFFDRPALGGEVSALAGYLGMSLVTVDDARPMWGTPYDSVEKVNPEGVRNQCILVGRLVQSLARAPRLQTGNLPRMGFSNVTGRAKFLRHGELFADQAAPGTVILAFQGPGRYHAVADETGTFRIKGVADKKHVWDKVIIEGYRFDPADGSVAWAIDKRQTGKHAYRVKMDRRSMETDLVMFACKESTVFNLLEPRSFRYMTKIDIIDGRREALPLRYWYSRIDTRSSIIDSIYLEPGTPLKMTLSDTVLRNKMILINAGDTAPEGIGYRIEKWPFIYRTGFRTARDMWALLGPRIDNLEKRGIFNERIRGFQQEGVGALEEAEEALTTRNYSRFSEAASKSWALAIWVYDDVEKTQKDVLFGVLFYIALFVPFAFCMERLVFSFTDIHKRIIAFCGILLLLIVVIYNVHPAFQLAYSPMVVILAFFIMGLSMMVTLIIFFRFEKEMVLLQRQAKHMKTPEISRWKAFVAAFFLGVGNLRRRRLRTALTCITLIILTFTIMSFTSVKTMRRHSRLPLPEPVPYQGFLLKNVNWFDLPSEALNIVSNAFEKTGIAAPRVWFENEDRTRPTRIPVRFKENTYEAQGLIGLSSQEGIVTGLDRILVGGRWFRDNERQAVLLPERMAVSLGIDPERPEGQVVQLFGVPHAVTGIFSGRKFQEFSDLDGEPLTPVTFPGEVSMEMREVEMEALESGEDVRQFQGRYQHIAADLVVIIPHQALLAGGGHLKAIAVRPLTETPVQVLAKRLVDRFALSLFSGEPDGAFLYQAGDTLSYSGVPNVMIPLAISIFIVLNTMIGSVYERKREIGIYTSVGLAPFHVSFLFIAEALAFGVLSVVLGYLLAQTTAKIFADTSLWAGITVNYSSLAGVAAMILVILVVLVSVIYPSRVAAEIAMPDVQRSWELPAPRNNILEVTLPFLMKYGEHRSIGGFLFEYFSEYQDVSHGLFSTADSHVSFQCLTLPEDAALKSVLAEEACCIEECVVIHSKVWLAPFDFGIMQDLEVSFCPAREEAGFLEITVRLERKSGEADAWMRIIRAFLHDLRKELLVWRSLDESAKKQYDRLIELKQEELKGSDRG